MLTGTQKNLIVTILKTDDYPDGTDGGDVATVRQWLQDKSWVAVHPFQKDPDWHHLTVAGKQIRVHNPPEIISAIEHLDK